VTTRAGPRTREGRAHPGPGTHQPTATPATASVAQSGDDPEHPDLVEAEHPGFRSWQRAWRYRIAASRRCEPLGDGTLDPLAPSGRWAE